MNSYLNQIKAFARMTEKDTASFEEMLGMYYFVNYPVDEEKICERLTSVESVWKVLSERKRRVLKRAVTELCKERGREGFITGVKVGAQLMWVLLEQSYTIGKG